MAVTGAQEPEPMPFRPWRGRMIRAPEDHPGDLSGTHRVYEFAGFRPFRPWWCKTIRAEEDHPGDFLFGDPHGATPAVVG